jgi:peroxiredoxin
VEPPSGVIIMRWFTFGIVLLWQLTFAVQPAAAAAPKGFTELRIGDKAPNFDLPGVDDKRHTLQDFAAAKLLLVVFTCNHCPTAQAYESRIIQLDADYKDKGAALVAISPNDDQALRLDELGYTDLGDSFADMKIRAKERDYKFPYLYDGDTQKTALAYGVQATPQVYVFDAERKLRYVGRIDDSDVKAVTSHDARNALDALLAGKPVPVEKTRTFGCSTKWSDKRSDAAASIEKWNQEPVTLEPLDESTLEKLVKNDTDQWLLVNLWATFCTPCILELPEFVTINRMYRQRNMRVVTISMDDLDQVAMAKKILQDRHVALTNYISAISSTDRLADLVDREWRGALPHTVLIAPGGKVVYRTDGDIKPLEVRRAIVEQIGRTYANRAGKTANTKSTKSKKQ